MDILLQISKPGGYVGVELEAGALDAAQGCDQHKDGHLSVGETSLGEKIKVKQTLKRASKWPMSI